MGLEAQGARLIRWPPLSVPRALLLLAGVAGAVILMARFADWAQLGAALVALRAQPLLLVGLIAAYTGAFWLRAIAWRALATHRIGIFPMLAALQAALLVNHLLPFKMGELVRPALAGRCGLPLAEAAATTAVARNTIFYLATLRYGKRVMDDEDAAGRKIHLAEGWAFYQAIRPAVADASADSASIVEGHFTRDASGSVSAEDVERLYAALNEAAVIQALGIPANVRVTSPSQLR